MEAAIANAVAFKGSKLQSFKSSVLPTKNIFQTAKCGKRATGGNPCSAEMVARHKLPR